MSDADRSLADFRKSAVLRDGAAVCVRAIRPDDKERLRMAFARLSRRSVYQRFFHPVHQLAPDELRRLTEVDFGDHVAIVLTVGAGSEERLIAVGRYIRVAPGGDSAEVAFMVVDEYQGVGAATLLLNDLVAIARRCGVRNFVALVLPDNRLMLEVFRRSGLISRESLTDGVCLVVLDVAAARGVRRFDLHDAIRMQWRRFANFFSRERGYARA